MPISVEKPVWVVLSGSGMKMFAFLGALSALVRAGFRPQGIRGTSGGAIVAGLVAHYWDPLNPIASIELATHAALKVNPARLLDPRWRIWRTLWPWGGPKGANKGDRFLAELRKFTSPTFAKARLPLEIVTFQVNLRDKRTVIHDSGDLPLAIRASMGIPFLYDPVRIGEGLHVDGGMGRNFALPQAALDDVFGLYFGPGENRPPITLELANNLDLGLALVDGMIDDNVRQSIEAAPLAEKIPIDTAMGSLEFLADDAKIEATIDDGYKAVMQWIRASAS